MKWEKNIFSSDVYDFYNSFSTEGKGKFVNLLSIDKSGKEPFVSIYRLRYNIQDLENNFIKIMNEYPYDFEIVNNEYIYYGEQLSVKQKQELINSLVPMYTGNIVYEKKFDNYSFLRKELANLVDLKL